MGVPEQNVIISGLGRSAVGRRLGRTGLDLTIDSVLDAIADAGLTVKDIDGLSCWPGGGEGSGFDMAGPGVARMHEVLRFEPNWYGAGPEGPGQLTGVISAVNAIVAGRANHVLVWRTVTEGSAQGTGGRTAQAPTEEHPPRAAGQAQWQLPFHIYSGANRIGMYAQRHMYEFGTKREHLGAIAVNSRSFAGLNPNAIYREPITMDDYMAARMISHPFCLYDCDVPCDGSLAFVLSRAEYAKDAPKPAVHINAIGCANHDRPSWFDYKGLADVAMWDVGRQLWSRTDLKPSDVDCAELYDGFTFITLQWLEALGFAPLGQGGPFVEGGKRIGLGGDLPLNTQGGQTSAGRLHGYTAFNEACTQLRGEGGDRQVDNAEVAVCSAGAGPIVAAILLTK